MTEWHHYIGLCIKGNGRDRSVSSKFKQHGVIAVLRMASKAIKIFTIFIIYIFKFHFP